MASDAIPIGRRPGVDIPGIRIDGGGIPAASGALPKRPEPADAVNIRETAGHKYQAI